MKHQIFEYNYFIKESDLDTFGHVNNAKYLMIYEEARWDFITKNGYGLETVVSEKKGPVLLEVTVKFKRELKNREPIVVQSQAVKLEGKIMTLKQWISRSNGEVCSEAIYTVGFFDTALRKLIHPTDQWLKACGISDK